MKTQVYKIEPGRAGANRSDAGSILVVVSVGAVIFFFLLGSLSSL